MRALGNVVLYILAFGVAGYAILVYALLPLGAVVHPDMRLTFLSHATGLYLHVFASSLALLTGPFQFSPTLRQRRPRMHRVLGRIYLGGGVLVGGLSGLYMSTHAFGGTGARLGFACLAIAWLYTGYRALRAIRRGAVAEHRAWMVRNFSLTLAAVTLRIYLPSSMVLGIPFETAYPFIAWLCWAPNLVIAERCFVPASRAGDRPTTMPAQG